MLELERCLRMPFQRVEIWKQRWNRGLGLLRRQVMNACLSGLVYAIWHARNVARLTLMVEHPRRLEARVLREVRTRALVNLCECGISDVALLMVMTNLICLQDAKLVHLSRVTLAGFELGLGACGIRLKKVKLNSAFKFTLSRDILHFLWSRGCRIGWDWIIETSIIVISSSSLHSLSKYLVSCHLCRTGEIYAWL